MYYVRYCLRGSMIEDDHSLMVGVMICNHGGFELVVDRLVSYCRLLLVCNVISLIIVPLDVGYCLLHSSFCLRVTVYP